MNTRNNWRIRRRRNRDKSFVNGSQTHRQSHIPIPIPTIPPRPYIIRPVTEPIVKVDNKIYELLSIFTNRLTRLGHYVYDKLERLKRDKYRKNTFPSAKELLSGIQQGKAEKCREKSTRDSYDQIGVPTKDCRAFQENSRTELPGLPRTIDITQCPYISS